MPHFYIFLQSTLFCQMAKVQFQAEGIKLS